MKTLAAVAALFGVFLVAVSLGLYLLYQETEIVSWGAISIVVFSVGAYCLALTLVKDPSLRRILPVLIAGGAASLAMVAFGFDAYIDNSYYSDLLAAGASRLTAVLFGLAGVDARVSSGNVLVFPDGRELSIGPLCSGAYSSLLFLLLSVVMTVDFGRTATKTRLAVAVMIGVLGVNLANVFRITFLASVLYLSGLDTMLVVHQYAGYIVFLAFMGGFWWLSIRWLSGTGPRPARRRGSPPGSVGAGSASHVR